MHFLLILEHFIIIKLGITGIEVDFPCYIQLPTIVDQALTRL